MATILGTRLDDFDLETSADGDILKGLAGNDDLTGAHAGVTLYGGAGSDWIQLDPWEEGAVSTAFGDAGDDEIAGSRFSDRLYGGTENDFIYASAGRDTVDGGDGSDVLSFSTLSWQLGPGEAIAFTLGETGSGRFTRQLDWDTFSTTIYQGVEGVEGTEGGDLLNGNSSANKLYGGGGDDRLKGLAGDDLLEGGSGHDVLTGGTGADLFVFDGGATRAEIRDSSDRILDFAPSVDMLVLLNTGFSGVAADRGDDDGFIQGMTRLFAIEAGQFVVQDDRYATTLSARLIYDQDDGLLYYDANGALAGFGPVLVANIGAGLALTSDNFALI